MCVFRIICSRCRARRKLSSHVDYCQHVDQQQLTRQTAIDLDIKSTFRQPGSCQAKLVNADDGLEYIRRTRGRGSEKSPAASYALLQTCKKAYSYHWKGIEISSPFFNTAAPKRFFLRSLASARHVSPVVW